MAGPAGLLGFGRRRILRLPKFVIELEVCPDGVKALAVFHRGLEVRELILERTLGGYPYAGKLEDHHRTIRKLPVLVNARKDEGLIYTFLYSSTGFWP